jgi:murein tripeptide amidase MpaA
MSIISVLIKAKEISSLIESADWSKWNRKLKNYLSMIELWKILIEDSSESTDSEKHISWSEKQKQLKKLLDLILETSTRNLIERITDKNATQQYKILENEYNKISISIFSQMYKRVFKCSLFNHKSIQKYDDELINVRNKLIELERSIDELIVTCVFLNGLDDSYQKWKNMWINNQDIYIKKNRKNLNVFQNWRNSDQASEPRSVQKIQLDVNLEKWAKSKE